MMGCKRGIIAAEEPGTMFGNGSGGGRLAGWADFWDLGAMLPSSFRRPVVIPTVGEEPRAAGAASAGDFVRVGASA